MSADKTPMCPKAKPRVQGEVTMVSEGSPRASPQYHGTCLHAHPTTKLATELTTNPPLSTNSLTR